MSVIIKIQLPKDKKFNPLDILQALSMAGYRELLYSPPLPDHFIISIPHRNNPLTHEECEKIKQIAAACHPEAIVVDIGVNAEYGINLRYRTYADHLQQIISELKSNSVLIRDIVKSSLRAKALLNDNMLVQNSSIDPLTIPFGGLGMFIRRPLRSPAITFTYEDILIATDQLFRELSTIKLTNEIVLDAWQRRFCDTTRCAPLSFSEHPSANDESYVNINLKVVDDEQIQHYYQESLNREPYYEDLNQVFREILHAIGIDHPNTIREYDPSQTQSAKFTLSHFDVTSVSYATFCFDIQRALLSCGMLNSFILNITFVRAAVDVLEEKASAFLKKYNLANMTPQMIERGLRMAALNNQIDDLRFLLDNYPVNVNASDSNPNSKKTALHLAVSRGHLACTEALLEANADMQIADADRETAWLIGHAQMDNIELINLLDRYQAQRNARVDDNKVDQVDEAVRRLAM